MEKIKSFIDNYEKILVAGLYSIAITAMVSLLMMWSKILAFLFIFIVVFELTFFIFHMESYKEDDTYKGEN